MSLHPGDRPFESWTFRIIWGSYLAFLSVSLMMAANTRAGNFDGFSFILPAIMALFGVSITAIFNIVWTGKLSRIGLCSFSVLGFGALVWLGYLCFPGLQASSKIGPFVQGMLIYMGAIAVVGVRLQRPVSPPTNDCGSYDTELFQVHFNNSWRIFQILLSLSAIVVVGIIVSIGTLVLQRQEVIIQPLAWFIGGILVSFFPLIVQFWYEMRFLKKAYKY